LRGSTSKTRKARAREGRKRERKKQERGRKREEGKSNRGLSPQLAVQFIYGVNVTLWLQIYKKHSC